MSKPSKHSDPGDSGLPQPTANRTISRWFWGTIVVFAVVSIALTLVAFLRPDGTPSDPSADPPIARTETPEDPMATLGPTIFGPTAVAFDKVSPNIEALLNVAYQPVYDAIPIYTDFHYSVSGQYIELTQAALGTIGSKIHEQLFNGMSERLSGAASQLDLEFVAAFVQALDDKMAEVLSEGGVSLRPGSPASIILSDAKERVVVTAPIATTAATVTGVASLKLASKAIASKLGLKIAAKVASKGAAKGGGVLVGAGSGAALCSWTGPAAAACAVAGGAIAWFAVDTAVVELDQYFNRSEFEAELRDLVDKDKASRRQQFENALRTRAEQMDKGSRKVLVDFTLSQLFDAELARVCQMSDGLLDQYSAIQNNLNARGSANISAFRNKLKEIRSEETGDYSILSLLVTEIEANLAKNSSRITVDKIEIRGNFPMKYRTDRDVSGLVAIDGKVVGMGRASATQEKGFFLAATLGMVVDDEMPITIKVALNQHRRIWFDRKFGKSIRIREADLFHGMTNEGGLQQSVGFPSALVLHADEGSFEEMDARSEAGNDVTVSLVLSAARLPDLGSAPECMAN